MIPTNDLFPLAGFIPTLSGEKWAVLGICAILLQKLWGACKEVVKQMEEMDDDDK